MSKFNAKDRQRIIDGYLADSGANLFVPAEFVDWLADRRDHEAYEWFFGQGDETAAREHRILMARKMANGLRITITSAPPKGQVVSVTVREFPALVSPVSGRHQGGGYQAFDPTDPAIVAELRRQGMVALRGWLARYRGVMEMTGVDLAPIEEIAASNGDRVALSA